MASGEQMSCGAAYAFIAAWNAVVMERDRHLVDAHLALAERIARWAR